MLQVPPLDARHMQQAIWEGAGWGMHAHTGVPMVKRAMAEITDTSWFPYGKGSWLVNQRRQEFEKHARLFEMNPLLHSSPIQFRVSDSDLACDCASRFA